MMLLLKHGTWFLAWQKAASMSLISGWLRAQWRSIPSHCVIMQSGSSYQMVDSNGETPL
jgi:hypothetical protein